MIYICVPSHNEGQTVGVVLWKVRQVMAEAGRDYQILVADDGSTDRTQEVLEPYTRVLPLTVMRSDERRGYAASLEMLLREAVHRSEYPRRDAIVVMQADFTEEPGHIATLLKRIESGADAAVSDPVRKGRPALKQRVAHLLASALLRRFDWPDSVKDPLAGFHAYRVSSMRRALEAREDKRLLRWNGAVANAALLQAVAPHARRVDVVEWTPHPERRQRESRFDFGTRMSEVWAFSRNREAPGVIPVSALAPTSVMTARSASHRVTAASLREAGVTLPGDRDRKERRRTSARNGKGRAGVKEGRSSGSGAPRQSAKRTETGAEDAPRRRKRKPASASAAPEEVRPGAPEAEATESGSVPERRRKRPRRRRRSSGEAEAGSGPESAKSSAGADAAGSEVATGDATAKPRRRRGRRGGRRRSGQQRPGGAPAEQGQDAADSPPDRDTMNED